MYARRVAGFEVFTKRMVPLAKAPYVTIQRRGTISFNAAAYSALGEPSALELLFDAERNLVGFRPVDDTAEHAYGVRNQSGKPTGPYVLSGTAFVKYYGIDTSVSRRWPATFQDERLLVLDLNAPGTVVTSNRTATVGDENG